MPCTGSPTCAPPVHGLTRGSGHPPTLATKSKREVEDASRSQTGMNTLQLSSSQIPNSHFEAFSMSFPLTLRTVTSRNSHCNINPRINFTPLKTCKMFRFPHEDLFLFCCSWHPFVTGLTHFCPGESQRVPGDLMSRSITVHKKRYCLFKGYLKVDCYLIAYILQIYSALWMNLTFLYLLGEKNRTEVNLELHNTTLFPREMKGHSNRYLHNNTLMNVCTQFSHFANLRLGILNSSQRTYSLCAVKYVVLCPNNARG